MEKSCSLLKEENDVANYKKYMLDFEIDSKGNETKYIKISRENVFKVNAMLESNSSYKNSGNKYAKPRIKQKQQDSAKNAASGWNKELYVKTDDQSYLNNIKGLVEDDDKLFSYIGSSAFWFERLKECIKSNNKGTSIEIKHSKKIPVNIPLSIEYVFYKTICAVDNENSTHLNGDGIGRALFARRLYKMYSKGLLIDRLVNSEYEIINELCERESIGAKKSWYCLSFATKWCCYACLYMFTEDDDSYFSHKNRDNYAKVDGVVKKALKEYCEKLGSLDYKFLDDNEEIGKSYAKYINIVDAVRTSGKEEISRNGLDHLLWYSNKGLFSDEDDSED